MTSRMPVTATTVLLVGAGLAGTDACGGQVSYDEGQAAGGARVDQYNGVDAGGGAGGVHQQGGGRGAGGAGGTAETPCTGTMESVGRACPSTYRLAVDFVTDCSSLPHGFLDRWVGVCGGFLAIVFSPSESAAYCFYDGGSLDLVGGRFDSDIAAFCAGTSLSIYAGSYPSYCPTDALTNLGGCFRADDTGGAAAEP